MGCFHSRSSQDSKSKPLNSTAVKASTMLVKPQRTSTIATTRSTVTRKTKTPSGDGDMTIMSNTILADTGYEKRHGHKHNKHHHHEHNYHSSVSSGGHGHAHTSYGGGRHHNSGNHHASSAHVNHGHGGGCGGHG